MKVNPYIKNANNDIYGVGTKKNKFLYFPHQTQKTQMHPFPFPISAAAAACHHIHVLSPRCGRTSDSAALLLLAFAGRLLGLWLVKVSTAPSTIASTFPLSTFIFYDNGML